MRTGPGNTAARLVLFTLLAFGGCAGRGCSDERARNGAPAAHPVRSITGWVLDKNGPVADAEVRLVSVTPQPCPCEDRNLCRCPEAIAQWRRRTAECRWPHDPLVSVRSGADGRFVLPFVKRANGIEVLSSRGTLWLDRPDEVSADLALELRNVNRPRVSLDEIPGRGAYLYEDGRCVPVVQDGTEWIATAPLPDRAGVLFIDRPSKTSVIYRHRGGNVTSTSKLRPSQFHPGEWVHGLEAAPESSSDNRPPWATRGPGSCRTIEVRDPEGRPVPEARVWYLPDIRPRASAIRSATATTDVHGRVCLEAALRSGVATVEAPRPAWGSCGGEVQVRLENWEPDSGHPQVTLVTLPVSKVDTFSVRGRVVTADGYPVVDPEWRLDTACSMSIFEGVQGGLDGTFVLPPVPRGRTTVTVKHPWYAEKTFDVWVPAPERTFVLDRGATWTGRVIDPEKHEITSCNLWLRRPGESRSSTCQTAGFDFRALHPDTYELKILLREHPVLGSRALVREVEVKHHEQRTEDIFWPEGASITGQVVTEWGGAAVADTVVYAIPEAVGSHDVEHPTVVTVRTDEHGFYAFHHLSPGRWVLRVRNDREVTVPAGTRAVRLTVP